MDVSIFLKLTHVTAAVLWVGGGFSMILACSLLSSRRTAETQLAIIRATITLAPRLFIPASLITLASGLGLVFIAGWGWQPFTILGLAGIAFTAGFGALVLGPSCAKAVKMADAWGAVSAQPMLRRLQRLAIFDYAVQFAIVFLMIVKPSWGDSAVFGGIAGLVALAILATFRPFRRCVA